MPRAGTQNPGGWQGQVLVRTFSGATGDRLLAVPSHGGRGEGSPGPLIPPWGSSLITSSAPKSSLPWGVKLQHLNSRTYICRPSSTGSAPVLCPLPLRVGAGPLEPGSDAPSHAHCGANILIPSRPFATLTRQVMNSEFSRRKFKAKLFIFSERTVAEVGKGLPSSIFHLVLLGEGKPLIPPGAGGPNQSVKILRLEKGAFFPGKTRICGKYNCLRFAERVRGAGGFSPAVRTWALSSGQGSGGGDGQTPRNMGTQGGLFLMQGRTEGLSPWAFGVEPSPAALNLLGCGWRTPRAGSQQDRARCSQSSCGQRQAWTPTRGPCPGCGAALLRPAPHPGLPPRCLCSGLSTAGAKRPQMVCVFTCSHACVCVCVCMCCVSARVT